MESDYQTPFASAIGDFRAARSRAQLKEILALLKGESTRLLPFDEVRQMLRGSNSADRGLQDIPLDAIVGSVGRYTDFTRDFLPRQQVSPDRWARVALAVSDLAGVPPVEVYQIGQVYFVKDGNHRVSVARQLGATHIQAYVTEVRTRVPLTPDVQPDDLILKAEYADFLETTHLDELRPEADLSVTVPGQYEALLEHIAVHRHYMGLEQQREIPYAEAVAHWYDTVYLPVVQVIRRRGLLDSFPDRTETDLYLWIAEHRAALERELGWEIDTPAAASDLADRHSPRPAQRAARLGEKLLETISLDRLEPGPPPGEWRRLKDSERPADRLFHELLVPVNGAEGGWFALEQALVVAQRETGRLRGLHVIPSEKHTEMEAALQVQERFNLRCAEAGVPGELVIAVGEVTRQICGRARWTDLIVANLAFPPAPQPLARLSSGFQEMVQRCPRPILATPHTVSPLNKALLAYDGSPKAEEALYLSTYLAGQWRIPLVVVTVQENRHINAGTLEHARRYLEAHQVQAEYILAHGPFAQAILDSCAQHACDFLVMGGYGFNPVLEVVLGSVVDQVLRQSPHPILLCR